MKQTIILPNINDSHISTTEVALKMQEIGIIVVYYEEKLIGSVVREGDLWLLSTIEQSSHYSSLELLLIDYPEYDFKFIT